MAALPSTHIPLAKQPTTTQGIRQIQTGATETQTITFPNVLSTSLANPASGKVPHLDTVQWEKLVQELEAKLAEHHRALGEPVKVIDNDHVRIRESLMIPDRPYLVEYKGDTYEFVRKSDGSIVVSELQLQGPY
jgi:hypothetical protein